MLKLMSQIFWWFLYAVVVILCVPFLWVTWIMRREVDESGYKYRYLRYPFDDDYQYFKVNASSQEEADEKAITKMTELFEARQTVMTEFEAIA